MKSELKYRIPGHITKLTRTIFRRSEVIDKQEKETDSHTKNNRQIYNDYFHQYSRKQINIQKNKKSAI